MPSLEHEGLTKLVSERPELLPVLIRTLLGLDLPGDLEVLPAPETIRDVEYPEHRADASVVLRKKRTGSLLEAFVHEIQLRRDDDKQWSWPIHVAGVRARLGCPTSLVVITSKDHVARRMVLHPLVIGPRQIPHILSLADAKEHPALATLAVMVHGRHRRGSKRLGKVALEAVMKRFDDGRERDTVLLDLILAFLHETTLHELEDEMELRTTTRFSKLAKQHYAEGLAHGQRKGVEEGLEEGLRQGRRQAIVLMLRARGLEPSRAQRRRIDRCRDLETLDDWLQRAAAVDEVSQLFLR